MHKLWEWFYTHCTVYFSPIKNKSVSVANWRPSYAWAVETVKAVHTSCPVSFVTHQQWISISHWLKTITVFDTHAGILLQTVMFHLSLMVNKSVLACPKYSRTLRVTLSKQTDHFNLNQPSKHIKNYHPGLC